MQKNFKNLKTSSRFHFKSKRASTGPKREIKNNFLPIRSNPARVRKFKNKCRKILKIIKQRPGFISRRNGQGQDEKQSTKKISFLSVRTRPELENSKINAKKFQKLKNILQASLQDETGKDRMKNRVQKTFSCYPFEPDSSQKIQK